MAVEKIEPKPSDVARSTNPRYVIARKAQELRDSADELDYLIIMMDEQAARHSEELQKMHQFKAALAAVL